MILILESIVFCVHLTIFLPHYSFFPSALALSWSDWSSSTLASALDIMQGKHSVFQCIFISVLKSNYRSLFVQHNIPGTRSTQRATLGQDCSFLLLVGAPRPSQVIITGEKRVSIVTATFRVVDVDDVMVIQQITKIVRLDQVFSWGRQFINENPHGNCAQLFF